MALTTVVSVELNDAAMSPWGSGRNQLTVLPCLTPSRSPATSTMLSVTTGPELLLIRATVSVDPTKL